MANGRSTAQKTLIFLVKAYQYVISPIMGPVCRFYPTCSCYCLEAIRIHGIFKGLGWTMKRILRCHPWNLGGIDPVPGGPHPN